MIVKSYEIQKKTNNFLKYKLFLLYGENYGLKKDIKESIKLRLNQTKEKIELISLYENEILESPEGWLYLSTDSGKILRIRPVENNQ